MDIIILMDVFHGTKNLMASVPCGFKPHLPYGEIPGNLEFPGISLVSELSGKLRSACPGMSTDHIIFLLYFNTDHFLA